MHAATRDERRVLDADQFYFICKCGTKRQNTFLSRIEELLSVRTPICVCVVFRVLSVNVLNRSGLV